MNETQPARPLTPPPGPTLSFSQWTQTVQRTILEYVENVTAGGTGKGVTITYRPPLKPNAVHTLGEIATAADSTLTVRITPYHSTWYVNFERNGGFAMPPLAIDRFDAFTARNTAETIAGFFDAEQSTPNKKRLTPHTPKPT